MGLVGSVRRFSQRPVKAKLQILTDTTKEVPSAPHHPDRKNAKSGRFMAHEPTEPVFTSRPSDRTIKPDFLRTQISYQTSQELLLWQLSSISQEDTASNTPILYDQLQPRSTTNLNLPQNSDPFRVGDEGSKLDFGGQKAHSSPVTLDRDATTPCHSVESTCSQRRVPFHLKNILDPRGDHFSTSPPQSGVVASLPPGDPYCASTGVAPSNTPYYMSQFGHVPSVPPRLQDQHNSPYNSPSFLLYPGPPANPVVHSLSRLLAQEYRHHWTEKATFSHHPSMLALQPSYHHPLGYWQHPIFPCPPSGPLALQIRNANPSTVTRPSPILSFVPIDNSQEPIVGSESDDESESTAVYKKAVEGN